MTRKEMRAAAYEKLIEAMKLLASTGLPLLAEEAGHRPRAVSNARARLWSYPVPRGGLRELSHRRAIPS